MSKARDAIYKMRVLIESVEKRNCIPLKEERDALYELLHTVNACEVYESAIKAFLEKNLPDHTYSDYIDFLDFNQSFGVYTEEQYNAFIEMFDMLEERKDETD